MNKNVSVWRGSKTPPTNYHVWINEENDILLYDGTEWKTIVDDNNYEDLKQHLAHFPTIHKTNTISTNALDLLDNEFRLFEITQNLTVTDFKAFNKSANFSVKEGDLHLKGKYPITNSTPKSVDPTLSILEAINKRVSLVFKVGDVEMNFVSGDITTTIRSLKSHWIITGDSNNAFLYNTAFGGYLSWNGAKYILSSSKTTSFSFINEDNNCYEIRRNGTSTSLNPQFGNAPGAIIKDYTSGGENNKLYIIDSSVYKLPIISSNGVRSNFNKGEGFPYDLLFAKNSNDDQKAYINCTDADVKVKENDPSKYYLCGSHDKLAIVTNDGLVLDVLNNTIVKKLIDSQLQKLFCIVPHGYTSNLSFAICLKSNTNLAFNPHQGIINGKPIKLYDRGANDNGIIFVPYSEVINKHIPMSEATSSYSGLMSKEDKAKLDSFLNSSLYKVVQTEKNSPSASGSTYQFIDNITQNAQGVITATKKSVREATTSQSGLMSASDKTKMNNLKTVATTGNYDDLNNKPITINWSVLLEPQQVKFNMTSIESTPELVLLNIDNTTVNLLSLRNINLLDSYSMLTILNSTFTHILDVAISYDDSQVVNKRLYKESTLSSIIDGAQLQSGKNVLITVTEIYFTITFRSPSGDVYLHLCPLSCKTFDEYINWPNVPNKAPLSKNGSIFYNRYLVAANSNDTIRINSIYELAYP